MFNYKSVLFVSPHTDDGELGAGGSISKFIRDGFEVHYAAFSTCEESLPEGCPVDTLEKEVKAATAVLGIRKENLFLYKYPVRNFLAHRQEILEDLVKLKNKINPDLVFLPSMNDTHQDHYVIAKEGLRAFKMASVLAYELPWNHITFNTRTFVNLEKNDIEQKLKALNEYKSQEGRPYFERSFVEGLAKVRGVQIKTEYAEAFDIERWVIK